MEADVISENDQNTKAVSTGKKIKKVPLPPREDPPVLRRLQTGEFKEIDAPVFAVGRSDADVDFCIHGNRLIGRIHLYIVNKEGHYFVCDNNSKNHSWLNDDLLEPNVDYELVDGDLIRIANETFEYNE